MTPERYHQIDRWIRGPVVDPPKGRFMPAGMPVAYALRWCKADACACSGCANRSGGLSAHGVTEDEWLLWWQITVASLAPESKP